MPLRSLLLSVINFLAGRRNDSMQRGPQNIVAPTRKEVTNVYHDGARLHATN